MNLYVCFIKLAETRVASEEEKVPRNTDGST